MKKKLKITSLSKYELSSKKKMAVRGGGLFGCCCSGNGSYSTWNGVRGLPSPSIAEQE